MLYFREEVLREGFTKWHIGNLPYSAVIHRITEGDVDNLAHSHPFNFHSFVMSGGYFEKIYTMKENGSWSSEILERKKGDYFEVKASTIHEIISLPQGETFTMIFPDEEKVEWGFYEFRHEGVFYRPHYEQEFKSLK